MPVRRRERRHDTRALALREVIDLMTQSHGNVLVTDDDSGLRRVLRNTLNSLGFNVSEASDGEHALSEIQRGQFDVVLLDVNMPGMGGIAACHAMRGLFPTLQIVMLSVRDCEDDKVRALNAGADDYVTKPFSVPELVARLKAAIRRTTLRTPGPKAILVGEIRLDPEKRTVFKSQQQIHLTPKEFDLLHYLMAHAGSPIPHQKLIAAVWGPGNGLEFEALRTFIKQLRKKLEDNPGAPQYVLREPGVGYQFRDD